MAAFKKLHDISNSFESFCRRINAELFSIKVGEPFEDVIAKKMRDISLYTSKLRLLQAKTVAEHPQIIENVKNEQRTIMEYEKAASWKIIEQQVVKVVTQSAAVKKLITTPDQELESELIERKEKITEHFTKYRQKEFQLRSLEAVLQDKENQLLETRIKWDETVGKLKDIEKVPEVDDEEMCGPLHERLRSVVDKMEMMRWLVVKLVTSRFDHHYDWATDPHRRLKSLAIARQRDDFP